MKVKELMDIQDKIRSINSSVAGIWTRLNEMKEYQVGTEDDYQKLQKRIDELELQIEELENQEI
jgi:septal ring factor EnvC (AmiA/AmiB activator)